MMGITDIYRCSNCGSEIRQTTRICPYCGYNRQESGQTVTGRSDFRVVLVKTTGRTMFLSLYLAKLMNISTTQAKALLATLPQEIYSGTSEEEAEAIGRNLSSMGAGVEIRKDGSLVITTPPQTPARPGRGDQKSTQQPANPTAKLIGKLVPILFIFLFAVLPLIRERGREWRKLVPEFRQMLNEMIERNVETIEVVVAKEDIEEGALIRQDQVEVIKAPRSAFPEDLPEDLVAAKDLDGILKTATNRPIRKGKILVHSYFGKTGSF